MAGGHFVRDYGVGRWVCRERRYIIGPVPSRRVDAINKIYSKVIVE